MNRALKGRLRFIAKNIRENIQKTNARKINSSLRGASFVLRKQNKRRRSNPFFWETKLTEVEIKLFAVTRAAGSAGVPPTSASH
jgi:hypothetical protein